MPFHHAVKVHRNSWGLSIPLTSSARCEEVESKGMCLEFYFPHFSPDSPWHHSSFFLMASKALSKRAFIQTFFFSFFFWYIPIFDWIQDTGNRKENNQFHESLHAQFCLCTPSISFIFHCQSPLSWQRHKGFISQYQSPVSKIQKVRWSDEKNCIHALKPRSAVLPHNDVCLPFWFKFDWTQ